MGFGVFVGSIVVIVRSKYFGENVAVTPPYSFSHPRHPNGQAVPCMISPTRAVPLSPPAELSRSGGVLLIDCLQDPRVGRLADHVMIVNGTQSGAYQLTEYLQ